MNTFALYRTEACMELIQGLILLLNGLWKSIYFVTMVPLKFEIFYKFVLWELVPVSGSWRKNSCILCPAWSRSNARLRFASIIALASGNISKSASQVFQRVAKLAPNSACVHTTLLRRGGLLVIYECFRKKSLNTLENGSAGAIFQRVQRSVCVIFFKPSLSKTFVNNQ